MGELTAKITQHDDNVYSNVIVASSAPDCNFVVVVVVAWLFGVSYKYFHSNMIVNYDISITVIRFHFFFCFEC